MPALACLAALVMNAPVSTQTLRCEYTLPEWDNWRVARGFGKGATQDQAIRAARADAVRTLQERVGPAHTEAELAEIVAGVDTDFVRPTYDAATGQACVVALVPKGKLSGAIRKHSDALDAAIRGLVGAVKKRVRKQSVAVDEPTWRGSPAGELGHNLRVRIASAFPRVDDHKARHVVGGELIRDAEGCRLQPWLRDRRGRTTPLAPVPFHPKAMGLRACRPTHDATLADVHLGLNSGARVGSGGLRVRLSTGVRAERFCGGEPLDLRVHTSEPAWVRLYSVAADGRVMLNLPEQKVDGDWKVTPQLTTVRLAGGTRYRLVAVATPAGRPDFGARAADVPSTDVARRCIATGGLRASEFPPAVAVAALTYEVADARARGCAPDPAAQKLHDDILQILREMTPCR